MTVYVNPVSAEGPGNILDQAATELFERTFKDGMALMSDVSGYLHGAGRLEARRLTPEASSAYLEASMRLTTRLMQITSWLLVQKALREGDISPEIAAGPRYRLPDALATAPSPRIPEALAEFLRRADRLHLRIRRTGALFAVDVETAENPVASQIERVRNAFRGPTLFAGKAAELGVEA